MNYEELRKKEYKKNIVNIICEIIIGIIVVIFFFSFVKHQNDTTIIRNDNYKIESYQVDLQVNEDNTVKVKEIINVNFGKGSKDIFYRKIPLDFYEYRDDDTVKSNDIKISDIKVNQKFIKFKKDDYQYIRIGNYKKDFEGRKEYEIEYTYNNGKDLLENNDEFFLKLMNKQWEKNIEEYSFTISMPKEFDKSDLKIYLNYGKEKIKPKVIYTVEGNTIKGYLDNVVNKSQEFSFYLKLPEGYFSNSEKNIDLYKNTSYIFFGIVAFILWLFNGKDGDVIKTVEFYPPEGVNNIEVAYLYKGKIEQRDIISLIIFLAYKGYIKIEEDYNTFGKIIKQKSYKFIKLKEYDGQDENEKLLMKEMFKKDSYFKMKSGNKLLDKYCELYFSNLNENNNVKDNKKDNKREEISLNNLRARLPNILTKIKSNVRKRLYSGEVHDLSSLTSTIFVGFMIIFNYLIVDNFKLFGRIVQEDITIVGLLAIGIFLLYRLSLKPGIIWYILSVMFFIVSGYMRISGFDFQFILYCIYMIVSIGFFAIMKRKTAYTRYLLGKILGFKEYIELVEKETLNEMLEKDPEYCYKILPYAFSLGIQTKFIEKINNIALDGIDFNTELEIDLDENSGFEIFNSLYSSILNMFDINIDDKKNRENKK